jgi:polar amino acid transport system permease protein
MPTPLVDRRSARPAVGLAGLLVVTAVLVAGCAGSRSGYQYDWSIFFRSIFQPSSLILNGVWLTLMIAVTSQIIGVVLGVFGALGKMSRRRLPRTIAGIYVWFFRGTPLLVQISFIFYGLGVAGIYQWPPIDILGLHIPGEIQAGIFALGVNEGAYMSEIVRAGIISIDPGQLEAARSLGMTFGLAMRRIILPQAARVIVPPLGNEFNNMLKTTSLLVIISVPELYVTFSNMNASGSTVFHPFELFLAAAVWYLLLTTIWGFIQSRIEARLGRGAGGVQPPSLRERLFGLRGQPQIGDVSGGR